MWLIDSGNPAELYWWCQGSDNRVMTAMHSVGFGSDDNYKVMAAIVVVIGMLQLMPQKLYFESECFWICLHNTYVHCRRMKVPLRFSIGLDRVVHA